MQRPGRLEGKVAFITGAGAGIGRAAARLFAQEGAAVAIAEKNAEAGERVAREIEGEGGRALAVATDVTDERSVERAVAAVVARFGAIHVYSAAKGGVLALTRALAATYARQNVRVNAICPGIVLSDRIKARIEGSGLLDQARANGFSSDSHPFSIGEPIDIARVALFLASDESRMIHGATIPAEGGMSAY
jgi:NAD(P)-dependent dehydrogenase (short-subunit alcohol dehydrogenase family)